MPQKQRFALTNFSGGLNQNTNPTMIKDNESPDLKNVRINGSASVKRDGCAKYNSNAIDTAATTSITRYYKDDGTKYTVALCGTKLDVVPSGAGALTEISSSFTSGSRLAFETYINYLYMVSRDDGMFSFNGTTLSSAIAGAPAAKYITSHSERMWAASTDANKSRVFWSADGDPTSWSVTDDLIDVSQDDGDEITCIIPFLDNLIVFKRNSIWVLVNTYDPDNEMQLLKRVTDTGCIAGRTVVTLNNKIYFFGKNGFYEFDGVAARLISKNVETSVKDVNPTYQDNACAVAYENMYMCSYTKNGDTTNQDMLIYDTIARAWVSDDGKSACSNQMIVLNGGDDDGELLSAYSGATGYIYQLDSGESDDGDGINYYHDTKWFDMGQPEAKKKLKKIWVYASASGDYNLTLTYFFDLQDTGTDILIPLGGDGAQWDSAIWDTDVWGGQSIVGDRQQAQGSGRFIKYRFAQSAATAPVTVYGISALIRPKRPR